MDGLGTPNLMAQEQRDGRPRSGSRIAPACRFDGSLRSQEASTTARQCAIVLSMPKPPLRLHMILVCSCLLVAPATISAQQSARTLIVLHAARLLQVDSGTVLQPGEVLVEGERIRAMRSEESRIRK